jgi:ABC-type transporter Mla MlaB component
MEKTIEDTTGQEPALNLVVLSEEIMKQLETEKRINSNVMSIRLTQEGLIINDQNNNNVTESDLPSAKDSLSLLSGVYCQGVQYYDLKGVKYINNTGMSILIALLKSLLEMNVEVQFVNVDQRIKMKIKELGLEQIINFEEKLSS